jgi:hypothetical protein
MSHKAYVFDYAAFQGELAPLLLTALKRNEDRDLIEFIQADWRRHTLPWDASPLVEEWQDGLGNGGVQLVADIALTRFYDADDDFGIGAHWHALQDRLPPHSQRWLLGEPFGPPERLFDAGAQGSYLQSPDFTRDACRHLAPYREPHMRVYQAGLEKASGLGRGLYVTF